MGTKTKAVGNILKVIWNLVFAGKTINVKGIPVTLPPLDQSQTIPVDRTPVPLHQLVNHLY